MDGTATNSGIELAPTGGNGVDARSTEYGSSSERPCFDVIYTELRRSE